MNLLGMDHHRPLRNYWINEQKRRRTRRVRKMARTLRRNNNGSVNSGNWPANNRNRTRLARLNLGKRNGNSIAPNNWGSTPK